MAYIDNYKKYLDEIPADIEICKETDRRIVFGYTSDLDVLLTYNEEEFNKLIDANVKGDIYRDGDEDITDMESFSRIIAYYMANGLGGEADITDKKVVDYLLEHFEHTFSLGGTAAQGAAAMASVGMPLIAHISDKSKEVCDLMDYEGLNAIVGEHQVPIREIHTGEPVYHVVFSYTKGDSFVLHGKRYEVPISNRVILDYDTIHKDIVVKDDFKNYLEHHADQMISYNVSGFNGIIDTDLVSRRMKELGVHYKKVKEKNPDCLIYFESAHYISQEVKKIVYREIASYVDIMGMNEEELVAHMKELDFEPDKENLNDVLKSMAVLTEKYHVRGIIMHTKDYSMYYGDEIPGIDIEKALTMGNLLSGTRARVGHYGNLSECYDSLKLELSSTGVRFADELEKMNMDRKVYLVPSRYMEKPICTIGLGDTFVAGVQFAFVKN